MCVYVCVCVCVCVCVNNTMYTVSWGSVVIPKVVQCIPFRNEGDIPLPGGRVAG